MNAKMRFGKYGRANRGNKNWRSLVTRHSWSLSLWSHFSLNNNCLSKHCFVYYFSACNHSMEQIQFFLFVEPIYLLGGWLLRIYVNGNSLSPNVPTASQCGPMTALFVFHCFLLLAWDFPSPCFVRGVYRVCMAAWQDCMHSQCRARESLETKPQQETG